MFDLRKFGLFGVTFDVLCMVYTLNIPLDLPTLFGKAISLLSYGKLTSREGEDGGLGTDRNNDTPVFGSPSFWAILCSCFFAFSFAFTMRLL